LGGIRGMKEIDDPLTRRVIEAIFAVHGVMGPGFLEGIYQRALGIEFEKMGLAHSREHEVIIYYDGQAIGRHRLDLVVEGRIIVELKTVEELSRAPYAQVRSYLRATGFPVGLLVNFAKESAEVRRIEAAKKSP
jgi:GxxExxY protein